MDTIFCCLVHFSTLQIQQTTRILLLFAAYQLSDARPIAQLLSAVSASCRPSSVRRMQRHTSSECHNVGLRSCTLLLIAPLPCDDDVGLARS